MSHVWALRISGPILLVISTGIHGTSHRLVFFRDPIGGRPDYHYLSKHMFNSYTLKTNMTLEHHHWITGDDTSSTAWIFHEFFIVMLVFGGCNMVFLHLFTGEGRLLWFPFGLWCFSLKKIKASGLNLHLQQIFAAEMIFVFLGTEKWRGGKSR